MSTVDRFTSPSPWGRTAVVTGAVVALHATGLWALNAGLGRHTMEITEPEVIMAFMASPLPTPTPPPAPPAPPVPPPPAPAPPPKPQPKPQPKPVVRKPTPAPLPAPIADSTPAPNAPLVPAAAEEAPVAEPVEAAPAPSAPPPAPTPPAPPAPPALEQPSSNAAYLNNPAPVYPAVSRRMNEEGKVLLKVLISAEGLPQQVTVHTSSGFERLDRAAVEAVRRWRFVPGKRNGVPEAMSHLVPINFVLK